jgi:hypothetical protein
MGIPPPKWFAAAGGIPACGLQISRQCTEIWRAEAELPPDAEASLQHSKKKLKFGVRKRSFRLTLKLRFSTPKKLSDERYRS